MGMVVVGGAIVVAILNNWRTGVYLFLSWLLFEDFARKISRATTWQFALLKTF